MCLVGELVHVSLFAVGLGGWFGERVDAGLVGLFRVLPGEVVVAAELKIGVFLSFSIGVPGGEGKVYVCLLRFCMYILMATEWCCNLLYSKRHQAVRLSFDFHNLPKASAWLLDCDGLND